MNLLEETSIIPPPNAVKRFALLMGSSWEISTMLWDPHLGTLLEGEGMKLDSIPAKRAYI
jgi:hypothetical protein